MKPVELPSNQLHDRISAGDVIHEGDAVSIVTDDGRKYEFEVSAITDEIVIGNNIEVPISNISSIETKEHSVAKSGGLFVGSFILIAVVAAVATTF
jgi:hypothetical protein